MGLPLLLAQCACMFVASFAFGSLPLMFKSAMSGKRLKAVSVLGMGLLVGAALTIIIPEGVSTLYGALPAGSDPGHAHEVIGASLLSGFALMLMIESLMPHPPHSPPSSTPSSPDMPDTPLNNDYDQDQEEERIRPLPHHMNSSTPIVPKRLHIRDPVNRRSRPHTHQGQGQGNKGKGSWAQGLNATLGLVIHGAADGIALGASSLSGKGSLGLVVFLAVLIHKGPTALGLTTTLFSLHLDPPAIRKRLFIFSMAAPIGSIITYLVVKSFGWNNVGTGEGEDSIDALGWWTGIALIFSGGSFLYVATVIQPLSSTSSHEHSHSSHAQVEDEDGEPELGKYQRTALLVVGMLAPALLGWVIGDEH